MPPPDHPPTIEQLRTQLDATPETSPHQRADLQAALGKAYLDVDNPDAAITHLSAAVRGWPHDNPNKPAAFVYLGTAHLDAGNLPEAIMYLAIAADELPDGLDQAKAKASLGVAFLEFGKPAEAIACLSEALMNLSDRGIDRARAQINLGVAYLEYGRPAEAVGHLTAAISGLTDGPARDMAKDFLAKACRQAGLPAMPDSASQSPGEAAQSSGPGSATASQRPRSPVPPASQPNRT